MQRPRARFAIILATAISFGAGTGHAQAPAAPPAPDCAALATQKKLVGAALSSFMKKCERDAAMRSCESAAVEKKLAGAAKASFAKRCLKDQTTP